MNRLLAAILSISLLVSSVSPSLAQLVPAGRQVVKGAVSSGAKSVAGKQALGAITKEGMAASSAAHRFSSSAARMLPAVSSPASSVSVSQLNTTLERSLQQQLVISGNQLRSLVKEGQVEGIARRILNYPKPAFREGLLRNEFVTVALKGGASAEQIAQAVEALEPYNLQSATSYSKQLNMIDDTVLLNKLNNALNVILSVHNMLLTQGSDVDEIRNLFEEKCNFAEIKSFIKATKLRIASVNYMKHGEEAGSAREMLNIALEDLTFNFEKNGEPQLLELAEQYKQSVEYARSQLLSSADPQDPEYISLRQAFLDEVAKHGMANLNDPETRHKLNMHDRVKVINDILNKIRRKNEEDNILAAKYKGDKKYVRIEKRMKEKAQYLENAHDSKASWFAFTKNQQKIDTILLNIKEDVDDFCLDNDDIITVEGVFTKKIKSNVTIRFRQ